MLLASECDADALECVELDVDDLGGFPDALAKLFERRCMAVVVRGAYAGGPLAEAIERLQRGVEGIPVFRPHTSDRPHPIRKGEVYGWPLVACEDSLDVYLDGAQRFDSFCADVFGQPMRPSVRIAEIMGQLSGGRPVSLPHAPDGRPYCAATIRHLGEGDTLPFHYENESFHAPALRGVVGGLDRSTLMSFYVPMAHADRGGELRLYHVDCHEGRDNMIGRAGGNEYVREDFEREGYTVPPADVGDLLIFDGGRIYHEVTPVSGERWTMGGVFAFTSDRRGVHFWG